MPPEIRIVDRGELRLESLESHNRALEHDEEGHVQSDIRHAGSEEHEGAEMINVRNCDSREH